MKLSYMDGLYGDQWVHVPFCLVYIGIEWAEVIRMWGAGDVAA